MRRAERYQKTGRAEGGACAEDRGVAEGESSEAGKDEMERQGVREVLFSLPWAAGGAKGGRDPAT